VLRGLSEEGEGVAGRALAQLAVTDAAVAAEMEKRSSTADGNAIYLQALKEALTLAHNYIGTEHLLLGITAVKNNTARDVLNALGVPASAVRSTVMQILTSIGVAAPYKSGNVEAKLDEVLRRIDQVEKRLAR